MTEPVAAWRRSLRTLTATGYGLWALIGLVLTLDLRMDGRGAVLVALGLGLLLMVIGALARLPTDTGGLGHMARMLAWRPDLSRLAAPLTFLSMLAVAGLARGNNEFWATRVFAAALALCATVTLSMLCRNDSAIDETDEPVAQPGAMLGALFSGGQWLWLSLALQGSDPTSHRVDLPLLALLLLGMGSGLLSLDPPTGPALLRRGPGGMLVAALMFIVPCVLLAAASTTQHRSTLALCSSISGQIGLAMYAALLHESGTGPATQV